MLGKTGLKVKQGVLCVTWMPQNLLRSCSVMEQFVLKAVVAEFIRSGLEEAMFGRVLEQYISLCRFDGENSNYTSHGCTVEDHEKSTPHCQS